MSNFRLLAFSGESGLTLEDVGPDRLSSIPDEIM
jgi:hypothetical protein